MIVVRIESGILLGRNGNGWYRRGWGDGMDLELWGWSIMF